MKALLYLVLMLGSLLGATAQVSAGGQRLADEHPELQQDDGHCLNDRFGLSDLLPLPSDNEPRFIASEAAVNPSCQAIQSAASGVDASAAADVLTYPIRAPPRLII